MRKRRWAATLMALGLAGATGTAVHAQAPARPSDPGASLFPYNLPPAPTATGPTLPSVPVGQPAPATVQPTPLVRPIAQPRASTFADQGQPTVIPAQGSTAPATTPMPIPPAAAPAAASPAISGAFVGSPPTPGAILPLPGSPPTEPAQCPPSGPASNNLAVTASFKDGLFLWLDSPNKDFTMHLGGWMQYDNVFWNESDPLRAAPGARPGAKQGVASGVAQGGIGDLEDGTFFRRIRAFAEGTAYDIFEYRLILALENNQFSTSGLDEFWVGMKDVPIIGTIRVGHVKNQFGIEGDTTASSRTMTFMERSASSDSIYQSQNYVTGVLMTNNYLDQRVTWEATAFRADLGANSGTFFGDGQYGAQARLTGLPLYEDDGRDLLHLAVSGGWRDGTNNLTKGNGAAASESAHIFQTRARPELRDDTPAAAGGGPGAIGGAQTVPDANSNRLIDTGVIAARDLYLFGTELLWIRGPLSIQAEYGWQFVNGAVGFSPSGTKLTPQLTSAQDYVFSGGYVQVAYTLTGETRAYDKRLGTLAREYFGRQGPFSNLFSGRDENGDVIWGTGAWEVAGRYSYVNLNDGVGTNRIQGGVLNGYSLALNWYLNKNLTVMFDCIYDKRSDVPIGAFPGYTKGLGIEVQFQF